MSIKRSTYVMSGQGFFEPDVPIFVNRAYENFDLVEHSHEFIEMTYVSEGDGVHYISGETVQAEHGTLFFIPVGSSHVFRPKTVKKDQPLVVYNCLFPVAYLTELGASFPHASTVCSLFSDEKMCWFSIKDNNGEYHAMFRELHREFSAKPPGYLVVLASLILRILAGLYRHQLHIGIPAGERPQWQNIDEAVSYMELNYAANLKLGEIAEQINLSERQFSRLFQRQTGMSFTDYVQNIRMEAACRQLVSTRNSVKEIASAVGYADLKFFHKLFKKKTGITPRQYRMAAIDQPDGTNETARTS